MQPLTNKVSRLVLIPALALALLVAAPQPEKAFAANTACAPASAATGNTQPATVDGVAGDLTVQASHGNAFYIDSSSGQNFDAAYIGYRITSSVARTGLWAQVDGFTGGVISLANPLDSALPLPEFTSSTKTRASYFLLKALSTTSTAQKHTFKVFAGRPGATGSTLMYACDFTFKRVYETIKANSNKVTFTSSKSTPVLGETVSLTVKGNTGTVGAGNAVDGSAMWLTPVPRSSWPTRALRLESVSVTFSTKGQGTPKTFTDTLMITSLKALVESMGNNTKSLDYDATYTFRVIGRSATAVFPTPSAQISSGTQMKHSAVTNATATTCAVGATDCINTTAVSTADFTIAKSIPNVEAVTEKAVESTAYLKIPYLVTITNSGNVEGQVDQIIDTPDPRVTWDGSALADGTATYTLTSVSSAGTSTPLAAPPPPGRTGTQAYAFTGPFSVPSKGRIELRYTMLIPKCTYETWANTAQARIGDLIVGSSSSAIPKQTVITNCTTTVTAPAPTSEVLALVAYTSPATSLGTSTATLNGQVTAYNDSNLPVVFEWGTTTALTNTPISKGSTSTGSTPVNYEHSLTGLNAGTTYYFRIKAGNTAGEILSFVTPEPVGTPAVSTDLASNVTATGATLNATVDPNQNSVTVSFQISTSLPMANPRTVNVNEDTSLAFNTTSNPYLTLGGSFPTQVSIDTTSANFGTPALITNTTYYYRAFITAGSTVTTATEIRSFTLRDQANQTITFPALEETTYGNAAPVLAAASYNTSNALTTLPIDYTSATPLVCRFNTATPPALEILKVGDCTITANQPGGQIGTTYYNPAEEQSQTFAVVPRTLLITATTGASSKIYGDSDPTFGYTATTLAPGDELNTVNLTFTRANLPDISAPSSPSIVGEYSLTASNATFKTGSATNYAITYASVAYSIVKRAITVAANNQTKGEGGSDPVLTYSVTSEKDVATGDQFAGALTRVSGEVAGSYAITQGSLTIKNTSTNADVASNYDLTFTPGTLTISARSGQSITFAALPSRTYGDDAFTLSASSTSNLPVSYTATGPCTVAGNTVTITGAGLCVITAQQPGDASYKPAVEVQQSFAINKKQISVLITGVDKVYDSTTTASVEVGQLTGVLSTDKVSVDASKISAAFASATAASNKSVTVTLSSGVLTGADASNYELQTPTGVLASITKRPLTLTPDVHSKVVDAKDPTLTYSLTQGTLQGDDTLSGSLSRSPGETIGIYPISAGTLAIAGELIGSSTNYSVTLASVNFSITALAKTDQTITFTAPTGKTYGDAAFTVSATADSGLPVSFTVSGACTIDVANVITLTGAGECSVTATQLGNDTYNAAHAVTHAFTIAAKELTVLITADDKDYDGDTSVTLSIGSLTGKVGDDDVSINANKVSGVFTSASAGSAKTVTITFGTGVLGGTRASNYTLQTTTNVTATIRTLNVTITAEIDGSTSGGSKQLGQADPTFGFVATGLLSGDQIQTVTLTFTGTGNYNNTAAPTNEGQYALTPSGAVFKTGSASNYTVTYTTVTYTITAEPEDLQEIAFNSFAQITLGQTAPIPDATATSGLAVSYESSTPTICAINAGVITVLKAGDCVITAKQPGGRSSGKKYRAAADKSQTLKITALELVITARIGNGARSSSKIQGDPDPALSFASSGLRGGDTIEQVTYLFSNASYSSTQAPTSIGTYTVTPIAVVFGNGDAANYTVTYVSTTYTIIPREVRNTDQNTSPAPLANPTRTLPPISRPNQPSPVKVDAKVQTTSSAPGSVQVPNVDPGSRLRITDEIKKAINTKIDIDPSTGELQVTPVKGWTGRVIVPVIAVKNGREVEIFTEIVVNPDAPAKSASLPQSINRTEITWAASPSQVVKYEVELNGKKVCEVTSTSCFVNTLVGPKSKIQVTAVGNDDTVSVAVATPVVLSKPIPALVVNFAENSAVLSAAQKSEIRRIANIIKREGYTKLGVIGHTDSQGGTKNATPLSNARARATANYFRQLLPNVSFAVLNGQGLKKPVASNNSRTGQAKNRRSEISVNG